MQALQFVADNAELPHTLAVYNQYSTVRLQSISRHRIGYSDVKRFKLDWPGFAYAPGNEAPLPNAAPIQTSIWIQDVPGGLPREVQQTYGGVFQGSIPAGADEYLSDWINPADFGFTGDFPAHLVFYIKTQVDIPSGASWLYNFGRDVGSPTEAGQNAGYGNGATWASIIGYNTTQLPALPSGSAGLFTSPFKPAAIIGEPRNPLVSVLVTGDSIAQHGGGASDPETNNAGGWVSNGFMSALYARGIPWASQASWGSNPVDRNAVANRMKAYYKYASVAISEGGSNGGAIGDFRTLWSSLKSAAGSKITSVYQMMILQRYSSSNNYVDVAGQSVSTDYTAINAAITANIGANGLDGTFDLRPAEQPNNAWAVNGTAFYGVLNDGQGVHPSDANDRTNGAPAFAAAAQQWLPALPSAVSFPMDFTTATMPSGVTFTRGSAGSYVAPSGLIVVAPMHAPRFDYNPTTHAIRGLLYEPARKNFSYSDGLNSWQSPSNATLTANGGPDPYGGTQGLTLAGVGSSYPSVGNAPAANSWTANQNISFSYYASRVSVGSTAIAMAKTYGSGSAGTVYVDLGTGTVLTTINSPDSYTVTPYINGLYRVTLTQLVTTTNIGVNAKVTNGSSEASIPATTKINLSGQQLEVGNPTSLIPNLYGQGRTRSADQMTFTIPAGKTTLTYTFDDGTTQAVSVTPGASYTVPNTLNRYCIRRID